MYDTSMDSWSTTVSSMNFARYGFTMVHYQGKHSFNNDIHLIVSGRVYAVGGTDGGTNSSQLRPENTVEMFDGQNWTIQPVKLHADAVYSAVVSVRG